MASLNDKWEQKSRPFRINRIFTCSELSIEMSVNGTLVDEELFPHLRVPVSSGIIKTNLNF
jgi:hypothetical protein